jgi:hypothetical protein
VPLSSSSPSKTGAASAPNVTKAANRTAFAMPGKGLANEAKIPLRRQCRSSTARSEDMAVKATLIEGGTAVRYLEAILPVPGARTKKGSDYFLIYGAVKPRSRKALRPSGDTR